MIHIRPSTFCGVRLGLPLFIIGALVPCLPGQDSPNPPATPRNDANAVDYFAGQNLLQKQLYDLAVREFEKFLQANPRHELASLARYGLAVCRFRTSDFSGAIQELVPLSRLKNFEFAPDVWVMMAQCRMTMREWKQAASDAMRVVETFPEHDLSDDAAALVLEAQFRQDAPRAVIKLAEKFGDRWAKGDRQDRLLYFHAAARCREQEWEQGTKLLTELVTSRPDSLLAPQAHLLLAQSAERRGDLSSATDAYQRLTENPDTELQQAGWLGLARILRQEGNPEEALAALDRIRASDTAGDRTGQVAFVRGQALFDTGDYSNASKAFAATQGGESSLVDAADYWEAKCYLRLGEHARAVQLLSAILQDRPESPHVVECRYDLAFAHSQLQDDRKAASTAIQLLRDHPEHALAADAAYLAALSFQRQKKYDESLKYLQQFETRYFDHPLLPQVKLLAAESEYLAGRFEEAAVSFRTFLDEFPRHEQAGWVRQRLGWVLYRQERFDEALGVMALGIDGTEEDVGFRATLLALGDIYFRKSDYAKAIEQLERYMQIDAPLEGADDALMKLGLSYARTGHPEQAAKHFDALITQHTHSVHSLHARFELGQCQLALKQSEPARRTFERVVAEDPQGRFANPAMNHLGALASAAGDARGAADWYSRAGVGQGAESDRVAADLRALQAVSSLNDWADAERRARDLLKRQPSAEHAPTITGHLAIALSRQQKNDEALELLNRLSESQWEKMPQVLREGCRIEQAACLRRTRNDTAAVERLQNLLGEVSTPAYRAHALMSLAEIQSANGQCDQAQLYLAELSGLLAESTELAVRLGHGCQYLTAKCAYELKSFDDASFALDRLLSEKLSDELRPHALALAAESNYQLKRFDRALTALRELIDQYADYPAMPVALLRAGECHAELGQWKESESAYLAYLDRVPQGEFSSQARFGVGWAKEHVQQLDEAIQHYEQVAAETSSPMAARAQFQLGECLFAQGRLEDAIAAFTKVEVLYSTTEWGPAAAYESARCLKAMNKTVEARAQFEIVASKFAQTQWGRLAAESLGSGL